MFTQSSDGKKCDRGDQTASLVNPPKVLILLMSERKNIYHVSFTMKESATKSR